MASAGLSPRGNPRRLVQRPRPQPKEPNGSMVGEGELAWGGALLKGLALSAGFLGSPVPVP